MSLTASQIAALNRIESEMARKGFALGDLLAGVLQAPTPQDPGDGNNLDHLSGLDEIESAGAESRVLPAPPAGFTGMKIIRFKTDGGDVTIAAGNVLGFTVENFTLDDVGETIILVANGGGKWVQIGGDVTPA